MSRMWHFTRRRVFWIIATPAGSPSINHNNASDDTGRLGAGHCEPRSSRSRLQSNFCCMYPALPIQPSLTCAQLGGIGDDGTYALGHDALLCLKDLRKWLKFADGQYNRRDVARCMAEANLVKGDLLEILAKISPTVTESAWKHKIAVATCMKAGLTYLGCTDRYSGTACAFDMAQRNRPNRSDRKPPSTWPLHRARPDWIQARYPAIRPRQNPSDCRQDCASFNGSAPPRTNTTR